MRDNTAVLLFILILAFILSIYIIAALYFDGLLQFIDYIGQLFSQAIDAIKTLLEAIYRTFVA